MTRKTLLLARSSPPSADLLLALKHWRVVHCRLIETHVVDADEALAQQFAQARLADWLVFVSPPAVRAAQHLSSELRTWPGRTCAVGSATAELLNDWLSPKQTLAPVAGEGAAALLECQELASLKGQRVAIFAAPEGLPTLAEGFRQRGAEVIELMVYQRVRATLSDQDRRECESANCAYVGSAAFLEALLTRRQQLPLPVFVPSARVARIAEAHGCRAEICENSSESALITQIQQSQW